MIACGWPTARPRRHGFTLADVMITVLIIGILSAIATPRLADTLGTLTLEAAAKQVTADLRYARQYAKTRGKSQSVTFDASSDSYELNGINDLHHSSEPYVVVLSDSNIPVGIDSATFGSSPTVTFDRYGKPDYGGTIVISKNGETKTIAVEATTGEASIL